MDGFAFGFQRLDGAEGASQAQVIHEDAVIEVDEEVAGGEGVEDVALVVVALLDGGAQLLALAGLGCLGGGEQRLGLGGELAGELAQVLEHGVRGGGRVPV